ncbi:MAG: YaiO family outer membrane beta-barrel protein [Sediminibacterium sp.]
MRLSAIFKYCCFSILFLIAEKAISQIDTTSSDGLLIAAKKAAFDEDNYPKAKTYLYKALAISPNYADLRVFLGRIYTWTRNYDSAKICFEIVLKQTPGYEDACNAYADMTFWKDDYQKSLNVAEEGLSHHPKSESLLLRKARALNAMRRYIDADKAVQELVTLNKNNTEARALANRIRENAAKNKIGVSYDFVTFDKQFADPWHLISVDYGRNTGIGSITGRITYANRFKTNGYQYELEAYPRISNTFYSYVGLGYSDQVGVFPQWRGGFSLYANLPKSYEAELGVRYLKFSGSPTWVYTGYLGKYYKSWLFGARTYITPSTFTSTVSSSYNISARYYYASADDMLGFNVGYGISPDDRFNAIQINGNTKLISYKAGIIFKKKVARFNVFTIDGGWFNQEYLPKTIGNQYQISVAWLRRF